MSTPIGTYRTAGGRLALVVESADPRDAFRFLAFERYSDLARPGGWARMGSTPAGAMPTFNPSRSAAFASFRVFAPATVAGVLPASTPWGRSWGWKRLPVGQGVGV